MADLALSVSGRLRIVESIVQNTLPVTSCTTGDAVQIDGTTGKFTKADAGSAGNADIYGVLAAADGNVAVTAIRKGVVDGFDLSGLSYWVPVYLSDTAGKLADAAGTVSKVVGYVMPVFDNRVGASPRKVLFIDL